MVRLVGDLAKRRGDLRVAPRLHVSVATDEKNARVAQLAGKKMEERERRRIGAVEIVQDEHQRLTRRGAFEDDGYGIKQGEACVLGLE